MLLNCKNLSKIYGVDIILDNINFSINEGDRIGIVGKNGSGKTTLFKILSKELEIDRGNISIKNGKKIGYLSQNSGLDENNTLYNEVISVFNNIILLEEQIRETENMMSKSKDKELNMLMEKYSELTESFDNLGGYEYQSRAKGIIFGLGFNDEDFTRKISSFSGGQKTRIALGIMLLKNPDLLLLDEPTNYLDIETVQWLESYLLNYDGTYMIISHDRYFLNSLVTKIFEIENHKLKEFFGNYSEYIYRKKENLNILQHKYENQQKEIKRQQEIIKRFKQYNREKTIKRAESREKMLTKLDVIDKPYQNNKKIKIKLEPQIKSGKVVLEVNNLTKSYGNNILFKNISFNILRGEKVGIIGANGTGKTTLLKIIKGQLKQDEGQFVMGHNVFENYFDQEQKSINLDNDIITEIWSAKPFATEIEIRNVLAAFMFTQDDIYKNISNLSGGEKARIILAKLMLSKANFLLMDEPTNHIDIETKEVLEDTLSNYLGTLLVISHDRYFLNKVVNKIIVLNNNSIDIYNGNYDYYINKRNNQLLIEKFENQPTFETKTEIKNKRKKENNIKNAIKKMKEQINNIEDEISSLESKKNKIEEKMCKKDFYNNKELVDETNNQYNEIKKSLDNLFDKWTTKQTELESFIESNN